MMQKNKIGLLFVNVYMVQIVLVVCFQLFIYGSNYLSDVAILLSLTSGWVKLLPLIFNDDILSFIFGIFFNTAILYWLGTLISKYFNINDLKKNKFGIVLTGTYLLNVLVGVYSIAQGGDFSGIILLVATLPWIILVSFLLNSEIIAMIVGILLNTIIIYFIGVYLSKVFNIIFNRNKSQ
ncbi:MAG: hypothetical protein RL292_630 [Candidatus Parcubacteria bacterium]|jgi:hypothetical protein